MCVHTCVCVCVLPPPACTTRVGPGPPRRLQSAAGLRPPSACCWGELPGLCSHRELETHSVSSHPRVHPQTCAPTHPCSRAPTHMHPCAPMCTPAAPQRTKLSPPRCRGPGDVGGGQPRRGEDRRARGERAGRDERCAASCADSRSSSAALPYEQELKPHRKPQGFPKGLSECSLPPGPAAVSSPCPVPTETLSRSPLVPQDPALAAPLEAPGCPCPAPHLVPFSHGSRPAAASQTNPLSGLFGFFYFVFLPSPLNHTETPPGAARAQPPASPHAQLPPPQIPRAWGGSPGHVHPWGRSAQHRAVLSSSAFPNSSVPWELSHRRVGDPGAPAAAAGAALVGFCAGFCFLL